MASIKEIASTWSSPILIVDSFVGKGNISVGEAIREALPLEGDVHTVSLEKLLSPRALREDLEHYRFISNHVPLLLNLVYRCPFFYYRKYAREKILPSTDLIAIKERILSAGAKTVICISHRPAFWISALKKRHGLDIKLWGVLTEFGKSLGWKYIFWESVDGYISPLKREELNYDFPKKLCYVMIDPPCRAEFYELASCQGDVDNVLFVAGYWGQIFLRKAIDVLKTIVDDFPDVRIAVVCGTNKTLRQKIAVHFAGNAHVAVYGEAESLKNLMRSCASVITKPGFSTLVEAHAAKKALFLLKGMPVAEDHNASYALTHFSARWFTRENFARWYHSHTPSNRAVTTEIISCPICGSALYEKIMSDYDRLTYLRGMFSLVKCKSCYHFYVNPRPIQEELKNLYPDEYPAYGSRKGDSLFILYHTFRNIPFIRFLWKLTANKIRRHNEVDLGIVKVNRASNIIDIGCAIGIFLDHMRWLTGCKVKGVECSKVARERANELLGKNVVCDNLWDTSHFLEENFELITMWFVLEHFAEPMRVLERCRALLKKGGWLVFSVPYIDGWTSRLFRKKWAGLDLPRHLNFFTLSTLRRILEMSGFRVVKIRHGFSSHNIIKSLQILFYGRRSINKGLFKHSNYLIKVMAWPFVVCSGLFHRSNTIIVYARKKYDAKNE